LGLNQIDLLTQRESFAGKAGRHTWVSAIISVEEKMKKDKEKTDEVETNKAVDFCNTLSDSAKTISFSIGRKWAKGFA